MIDIIDSSQQRLRVAVITDLHYTSDGSATPKYLPKCAVGQSIDPMLALIEMVNTKEIKADLLLCPGDIADRASQNAFKAGWSELKKLKLALQAKFLVASTGNHEVDSRQKPIASTFGNGTLDPIGFLQEIEDYPTDFSHSPDRRWVYWGRGYEVIETESICLILINSCHFHVTMNEGEYERGKISDAALSLLEKELKGKDLDSKKFRIVLLHHHPIPHEDLNLDIGRIEMFSGSKLIQLLENTYNDWLIIHGHKHLPRLIKAQGGTIPPIVFAAGSFGADLGPLTCMTKNQFYILELEANQNLPNKYQLKGRLEAYYWASNDWRLATEKGHGLPTGCGFDRNIEPDDLSRKVQEAVKLLSDNGKSYIRWSELCETMNELHYLMPSHIDHLRNNLRKLGVQFDSDEYLWFPSELS